MALAWLLTDKRITSVLIGVSKISQINDSLAALKNLDFADEELNNINQILAE